MKKLTLPLSPADIDGLHAGDGVLLTGTIFKIGRASCRERV